MTEYYIYCITCNDPNITDCYIGSTIQYNIRKTTHKQCVNNINHPKYNEYKYNFIRENGGWDNWNMNILETFVCENKKDAIKKEQEYMELLKPSLNIKFASGKDINKKKEWINNNSDKLIEYRHTYESKNKEKIQQKALSYYYKNKDKINNNRNKYKKLQTITISDIQ